MGGPMIVRDAWEAALHLIAANGTEALTIAREDFVDASLTDDAAEAAQLMWIALAVEELLRAKPDAGEPTH